MKESLSASQPKRHEKRKQNLQDLANEVGATMRVVPESTIAANVPREETALPLTAVVALTFQSADESWSAF